MRNEFTGRRAADVVRAVATELGLTSDQVRAVGARVQRADDRDASGNDTAWVDSTAETVVGLLLPTLRAVWVDRGSGQIVPYWRDWFVNVTRQAALDMDRRAAQADRADLA